MSNEINKLSSEHNRKISEAAQRAPAKATNTQDNNSPTEKPSSVTVEDTVKLSSQATEFAKLESKLKATPDNNSERINNIRSAIADGSYKVNVENIAEKMINMEKDLNA